MKKVPLLFILTIITVIPSLRAADFDGDGTGDVAVFRPSSGLWAVRGLSRFYFGAAGDYPVPLKFNSSSASDAAIFRPASGLWAVRRTTRLYYGNSDDSPVIEDFSGDGFDEIGIFRASSGLWAIRNRSMIYFGSTGDIPVPGDYNGDGTAAAGVFRKSNGLWAVRGATRSYFGGSSDLPVPADYNGDGFQDIGIFRSSSGLWAVRKVTRVYFGSAGDRLQPFDYTGDGTDRIGIFRPSLGLWAIRGTSRSYFGGSQDIPIAAPHHWAIPTLPDFGLELTQPNWDEVHMDKVIEAGAGTTRMGYLSWARLEPENTSPDNYLWEEYDSWIALYGEKGLTPVVIIADIPSWAGEICSGPFYDEARDDFAQFVGAVVSRYSQPPYNIKYWELFNEPDGTRQIYEAAISTWGYYGKEYADMLKSAYPAIKAADQTAQVIMGGLAYDNFIADGGHFYERFINDVIENGGADYFDILNFHYYYFARETWGNIIGKADALKTVLAGYGVNKPMICSEVGIWGYEDDYHLDLQARYVPMVYTRGLSASLDSILWFPLASQEGVAFEGGLLREEDFSSKPAYQSYQTLTAELAEYKFKSVLDTGDWNLEGYEFVSRPTGKSKYVIWAAEDTSGSLSFSYAGIRVVSIYGSEQFISDGGSGDLDGSYNGQIQIAVTSSPVYVESYLF
jgi:Cellulase (glycosyl hydrolase family 5)